MTISAKIIADSYTKTNKRITTFQLRYPRLIHSEVMTHRLFSRNASSSRAVPVARLIQDVLDDTAMPSKWGRNQPGMQAGEDWSAPVRVSDYNVFAVDEDTTTYTCDYMDVSPEDAWYRARDNAVEIARAFGDAEYHKQVVNRLLEPFAHINVVLTSTNFTNFFALRAHKDADPTIYELAQAMLTAYNDSEPYLLHGDNWHLPYVTHKDKFNIYELLGRKAYEPVWGFAGRIPNQATLYMIKVSVARCARVSYKTHDGRETTIEEDFALFDRLLAGEPLHASPAEHQATADYLYRNPDTKVLTWQNKQFHGNFDGVIQFRKLLDGEFQEYYAFPDRPIN